MLTNPFDNLRSVGEQEFRLIFPGSHRFEVGGFAFVIEHRLKER